MRFASSISTHKDAASAAADAVEAVGTQISKPDLLALFFTGHHIERVSDILHTVEERLPAQTLIGCSAEGVIAGDREIEREPAIAILAGNLPGVRIHPQHIPMEDWAEVVGEGGELRDRIAPGEETRAVIALGDPFTVPLTQLLSTYNRLMPGLPLVGGMASAARKADANVLILNDETHTQGLITLTLNGPVSVDTVVSQGCRPIGHTLVITKGHDNVIEQLGGKPAMAAFQETFNDLSPQDRQLLSNGLYIGRAITEYQDAWGRGDFLVRNVIGADRNTGAIQLTDYVRTGQTVQFHIRDAATASEDLDLMLRPQRSKPAPAGGLLFSCNGRGTRMFQKPCHDIASAREALPTTPIAGFFAAGEFGPVGGQSFIHGHTASVTLFRPINS